MFLSIFQNKVHIDLTDCTRKHKSQLLNSHCETFFYVYFLKRTFLYVDEGVNDLKILGSIFRLYNSGNPSKTGTDLFYCCLNIFLSLLLFIICRLKLDATLL